MATKKAASAKKSKTTTVKKPIIKKSTSVGSSTTKTSTVTKASSATSTRTLSFFDGKTPLLGAYIAEFVGTFILATTALVVQGNALLVGFALIAIVLAIGFTSGAHINPLITVGAWVTRKMSGKRALGYIGAQLLGAMLALVVMTAFSGAAPKPDNSQEAMMLGQQTAQLFQMEPVTGETKGVWYVFFAELLGASILGFAVAGALRERRDRMVAAFTYGLGFFAALTIAGGAAAFASLAVVVNPALALSMQAIDWTMASAGWGILVYMIAPIVGGVLGFLLFDVIRGETVVADRSVNERL